MSLVTGIAAAVFGIVLTILWLMVMLAALAAAIWIVAEVASLIAAAIAGAERRRAAGW